MCRNIRTLYNFEPHASEEEVRAAALQYVRKISGFTKPSQANAEAFDEAVEAVAEISAQLLERARHLARRPKSREAEAARRAPARRAALRGLAASASHARARRLGGGSPQGGDLTF